MRIKKRVGLRANEWAFNFLLMQYSFFATKGDAENRALVETVRFASVEPLLSLYFDQVFKVAAAITCCTAIPRRARRKF